jgi:hydrogenase maturation protease
VSRVRSLQSAFCNLRSEIIPRALIITFGNPLRGDDAVGYHAGLALQELIDPRQAEVLILHQLTPELAEPISQSRLVVFLDAAADLPPGKIACRRLRPASPKASVSATVHHLDGPTLLRLAKTVYKVCPPAYVVRVGVLNTDFGAPLSHALRRALPRVLARTLELIAALPQ